MGWPLSRPRCAVSGAEHALSAGERRGFSGGPPGGCAPAGSSAVGPPFVCRPPPQPWPSNNSQHSRPPPRSPIAPTAARWRPAAAARRGTAGHTRGGPQPMERGGERGKKGTGGVTHAWGSPSGDARVLHLLQSRRVAAVPPQECHPLVAPPGASKAPATLPHRGTPVLASLRGWGLPAESPLYTHIGDSFVWGGGEPPKSPPAELRHPRGAKGLRQRLRRARFLGFWPLPGSPSAIRRQGCFWEPSQDVSRAFCPPRAAAGTGWGCLP